MFAMRKSEQSSPLAGEKRTRHAKVRSLVSRSWYQLAKTAGCPLPGNQSQEQPAYLPGMTFELGQELPRERASEIRRLRNQERERRADWVVLRANADRICRIAGVTQAHTPPAVVIVVTTVGQPPVGARSSQLALVITPVIPALAKARMKCWAAAQKSELPIVACHTKEFVPLTDPVGHDVE